MKLWLKNENKKDYTTDRIDRRGMENSGKFYVIHGMGWGPKRRILLKMSLFSFIYTNYASAAALYLTLFPFLYTMFLWWKIKAPNSAKSSVVSHLVFLVTFSIFLSYRNCSDVCFVVVVCFFLSSFFQFLLLLLLLFLTIKSIEW